MIPPWVEACVPLILITGFVAAMGGLQVRCNAGSDRPRRLCAAQASPEGCKVIVIPPKSRCLRAGRSAARVLRQTQGHQCGRVGPPRREAGRADPGGVAAEAGLRRRRDGGAMGVSGCQPPPLAPPASAAFAH